MASLDLPGDKTVLGYLLTYKGKRFHPAAPTVEEIDIEDIAHALANQCRFGGHTSKFYSVAQHSILVSENVPDEDRLYALLHDASEAYLVDIPRPIKYLPGVREAYQKLEFEITELINQKFNLPVEEPKSIKRADNKVCVGEMRDLMAWVMFFKAEQGIKEEIVPWSPEKAERTFLKKFKELSN